jgi:nucleoside-diphosphate-sugar epimerase
MAQALKGEAMPIFGDGTQTRSFSYISTVARCIADAPLTAAAHNETFNVGGDEQMSVSELARHVADALEVPAKVEFLPERKEVQHAHCRHDLARKVFPKAYREAVGILSGLKMMAEFVRSEAIPAPTECPAPVEIMDLLPKSWSERLSKLPR